MMILFGQSQAGYLYYVKPNGSGYIFIYVTPHMSGINEVRLSKCHTAHSKPNALKKRCILGNPAAARALVAH